MERNEFWLAESSPVEYSHNYYASGADIGFTGRGFTLQQSAQQKMNEQRDAAFTLTEDYHEAF